MKRVIEIMKRWPLSVIIVNWNTGNLLSACLESLQREWADAASLQIIVVDNSSTDDSLSIAQARYENKADFIKLESNIGFGPANNVALDRVLHPYTLLLNPDTVVVDKGIGQMIAFMEAHQDAGFVGCRLLNPDRTVQHSINKIPTIGNLIIDAFAFYKLLSKGMNHIPSYDQITRVGWLRGAFLLAKTDLLKKLGGFDPNFFMYGEDLDICYRASLLGYHNYFVPFTSVVHYGNVSGEKKYGDVRLGMTFKSLKLFLVKFHGELYATKYLHILTESYRLKMVIQKIAFHNQLKIQVYEAYINALSEMINPKHPNNPFQ